MKVEWNNEIDSEKCTPLTMAAKEGYIKIVEILVKNHAKVNVADKDGKSPFHFAIQNGHLEIAEFLHNNGAVKDNKSVDIMFKKLKENKTTFKCHFCCKTVQISYMLNCGHLPFCEICSKMILDSKEPNCPVCNKKVNERHRAFLESVPFSISSSEEVTIID